MRGPSGFASPPPPAPHPSCPPPPALHPAGMPMAPGAPTTLMYTAPCWPAPWRLGPRSKLGCACIHRAFMSRSTQAPQQQSWQRQKRHLDTPCPQQHGSCTGVSGACMCGVEVSEG
jgi:hypothetical protein